MCKIKVVDQPCGRGKTSWAIEYMNNSEFERFIYITPILDEIKRVKKSCNRNFKEPDEKKGKGRKTDHFYKLLDNGEDILSTHSLFQGIDKDTKDKIKQGEYILILDEVMEVVEQLKISKHDIEMLLAKEVIKVDDDGKVHWNREDYKGEFSKYYKPIKNGDVYLHNDIMILWTFPCDIFDSFKEVYILTYLFKGQVQRYYYDMNNVEYEYKGIKCSGFGDGKHYQLCEYQEIGGAEYKDLINIYQGKLNDIGTSNGKNNPLSKSWYDKATKKQPIRTLKDNTYNYFTNVCKGSKSDENMWTTFKDYRNECKGKRYAKGFVNCGARATNDFKHKKNLAYLINRFYNPMIEKFFISRGVTIDQDNWALAELIQWMFRSAIREHQPINIYIPSDRMRRLLIQWLEK